MQRVWTGRGSQDFQLMRLCSSRGIALHIIRQGRDASARGTSLWWLGLGNPHMAVACAVAQPPSFLTNAKELLGSKVSASGASQKSARVESPRVWSLPIDQPPYFQQACGHIPEISVSNTPFPTAAATPFATVPQFCSSLPSISRQRLSSQVATDSCARPRRLLSDQAYCLVQSTPVPLSLATAMPPKAAKKPAPAGRRRSSAGVARRSGSGVQRIFALFPLFPLRAQTNRNVSGRPSSPREEEKIPAGDTGVKGDSTIPEQHRSVGCQASICATGSSPTARTAYHLPASVLTLKFRFEKSRYSTDRTARS